MTKLPIHDYSRLLDLREREIQELPVRKICGLLIEERDDVPDNEVIFVQGDKIVGRIINVGPRRRRNLLELSEAPIG